MQPHASLHGAGICVLKNAVIPNNLFLQSVITSDEFDGIVSSQRRIRGIDKLTNRGREALIIHRKNQQLVIRETASPKQSSNDTTDPHRRLFGRVLITDATDYIYRKCKDAKGSMMTRGAYEVNLRF